MTLVREPGSEIIAQYGVPQRGTWKNIAANTIPTDALYDSMNVFIREGKLRNRPGLTLYDDTDFLESVVGGGMVVTGADHIILAPTPSYLYKLSSLSQEWTYITPTSDEGMIPFAANENAVVDMAFMQTSGEYVAIFAQEQYALKRWSDAPDEVTTIVGDNIPFAKSVCIASHRVIGLVYPHTVVWSRVGNPADFDALAYAKRAQTGDEGICVRSLTALSFVLYKERSIHTARAQAGLDEGTAFSFAEPLYVEGPAGIYAVVNIGGAHVYMTRNGRIAIYDGASYPQWVADGLWIFLQDDINQALAHRIRGVYDYRLHTVTFYYPKKNTTGALRGMVIINLPFEGQDIDEVAGTTKSFLGVSGKSVVHACEKRWNTEIDRSLIFSSPLDTQDRPQVYVSDETNNLDEEIPFTCSFQTGLTPMPDATHSHVTVETFTERAVGYGAMMIEPVVSDMLETPGGTIPDVSQQYLDLEVNPINEYIGFNYKTRFFGLRYTWRSDSTVRYAGSVVYSSGMKRRQQ